MALLQTSVQELTGDWRGYSARRVAGSIIGVEVNTPPTQELGHALYNIPGLEGFLTFSSKVPTYRCLVIFPGKLHSGSALRFFDPAGKVVHTLP